MDGFCQERVEESVCYPQFHCSLISVVVHPARLLSPQLPDEDRVDEINIFPTDSPHTMKELCRREGDGELASYQPPPHSPLDSVKIKLRLALCAGGHQVRVEGGGESGPDRDVGVARGGVSEDLECSVVDKSDISLVAVFLAGAEIGE